MLRCSCRRAGVDTRHDPAARQSGHRDHFRSQSTSERPSHERSLCLRAASRSPPRRPIPTSPALCPSDVAAGAAASPLETRFFTLPGNVIELRIRVYPDKIHLDSHEPDLLPGERDWGMHYWEQDWRAGNDDTARGSRVVAICRPLRRRARSLDRAATQADQRAAATRPRPFRRSSPTGCAGLPDGDGGIRWQGLGVAARTASAALPDRWIATAHIFGQPILQATGRDIVRPLAVGPDPQSASSSPGQRRVRTGRSGHAVDGRFRRCRSSRHGDAHDDPARRVMTNPDRVPVRLWGREIGQPDRHGRAARQPARRAPLHRRARIPALRHTDQQHRRSPRRRLRGRRRASAQLRHRGQVRPGKLDATSNAMRVGAALGLPPEQIVPALGHIGRAGDQHEKDMRSMNTALWQAGWGYYLSNLIGFRGTSYTSTCSGGNGMSPDDLAWARNHFVNLRAQRRAISDAALRPAAIRHAAGHFARPVEAAGDRAGRARARREDAGSSDEAARQLLECSAWANRCGWGGAGTRSISMQIWPMSCAPTRSRTATACAASSAATISSICGRSSARIAARRFLATRRRLLRTAADAAQHPVELAHATIRSRGIVMAINAPLGTGRRNIALGESRAQLHRRPAGRPLTSTRSSPYDPIRRRPAQRQSAAASTAPCAAARARERNGADRSGRAGYRCHSS